MMSVELLLDPASDAHVRQQWAVLEDACLPSQARHKGASNAPHITLLAATSIGESGLGSIPVRLPLPVTLGGWVVFGSAPRSFVLGRPVTTTAELLALHRAVHASAQDVEGLATHSRPDDWTPHVTLASRMTAEEVGLALALLGTPAPGAARGSSTVSASATAVRHWNGDSKTVTLLG